MPNWVTRLNELKYWFESQPSILNRETGRKLFAEFESAMHQELRAAPGSQETTSNFVAMAPAIIRLIQRPDPVCSHCGMTMQLRYIDNGNFVVDHASSPSYCPEANKMWKVAAPDLPFTEQVLVPPFVREAMAKNS